LWEKGGKRVEKGWKKDGKRVEKGEKKGRKRMEKGRKKLVLFLNFSNLKMPHSSWESEKLHE